MRHPDPFLEVVVHHVNLDPGLSGLDAGYELGNWRCVQLASHMMDWLPEFSLPARECEKIDHANAVRFIQKAAKIVYQTDKFRKRGEFGELLLHIAMRQVFNTTPAISKIFYKSANNDTVKGFDAVHVVAAQDGLELWIGEAKFYSDLTKAIRDVTAEIVEHTKIDYLRDEFLLITNKLDEDAAIHAELKKLLDPSTTLDVVFKRSCIPVLLTYNSVAVRSHTVVDDEYKAAFEKEIRAGWDKFQKAERPQMIRIHLFLFPLRDKQDLVRALDERLKTWQQL